MAVGDTDVNICSTALNLLGESEISSFSDGSEIAGVCDKLYPGTKNTMLAMYPWSFATKKVQLAQLSSTPINEWQYEYQLPSDLIMSGPQAVYNSAATGAGPSPSGWGILTGKLQTDETTIVIDYLFSVDEASMPPYFVQALRYAMAAHLAELVTDQVEKADMWHTRLFGVLAENGRGGYLRQAMHMDGRSQIPTRIQTFALTDVR